MSLIRGVLLAGKFRTQHELNRMSHEDQRNTLIVEMTGASNQTNYQSFDDTTLAGMGAVMVFLRQTGIRTVDELKAMSADDQRNTMIVEMGKQTGIGSQLQGLTNLELIHVALSNHIPWDQVHQPEFIRGVLLAGKFRTQRELNQMSAEDQRNTLIVELAKHSNQSNYQAFDNFALAGMGAVMVFLRETGIRDDAGLKAMSADDQRNTLIVEMNATTGLGSRLQGLRNIDLVSLGLGADAASMLRGLPPPLQPPPGKRLQFRLREFIQFRSTDNFLQGARDEVHIAGIGLDSSKTYVGTTGGAMITQIQSPVIQNIQDDRVRGPWLTNPLVLIEFDIDRPGPVLQLPLGEGGHMVHRVFTVILMVAEEDSEDVGETFDEFKTEIKDKLNEVVQSTAASLVNSAAATAGQASRPVVGAAIGGAIGAIPGAVAGFFATMGIEEIITSISEGLANEVFSPKALRLVLVHPISNMLPEEHDRPDWFEIKEHGALYRLVYDWHIETG
jgi:hypothetical protein